MNRDNDKGKTLLKRTFIIAFSSFCLIFILLARLYYLEIVEGEKYKVLSDENRIATRVLIAPRGVVYDRNGSVLATNKQNFQALVIAEQTPSIDETFEKFKSIIPLNEAQEQKIRQEIHKNKRFVPVKMKGELSWDEVATLQLNASDIPGVVIDEGLERFYPLGAYSAHFLGYVGSVSQKEIEQEPMLAVPGFKVGKAGLEKVFEKKLRGQSGHIKLEVNAYGRVVKEIERQRGKEGETLVLSIDSRLQKVAQDAFEDHSGAAVVLDVHSGEILAFVSVPSFDPNLFSTGMSQNDWQALISNEKHPLTNKAVAGAYSPGSTFKIVVALAALQAGVITENTTVDCTGVFDLGGHKFHCWKHSGHGVLNVVGALKHSCDVFFYEVALKVGIDKIAQMARLLGLGSDLNIGFENASKGLVPDHQWKENRFKNKWLKGETVLAGIGQGYVLATPLQLATMTARVVNGGYEIMPRFTKLTLKDKAQIKKLPISLENIEIVKKGMFDVVNDKEGTAKRARFDIGGLKMGGKTGTTQVRRISLKERKTGIVKDEDLAWHLRNHALFVGYAPHNFPKYAVAVVVEHGSSGSGVAAPIASKILQEALKLGI